MAGSVMTSSQFKKQLNKIKQEIAKLPYCIPYAFVFRNASNGELEVHGNCTAFDDVINNTHHFITSHQSYILFETQLAERLTKPTTRLDKMNYVEAKSFITRMMKELKTIHMKPINYGVPEASKAPAYHGYETRKEGSTETRGFVLVKRKKVTSLTPNNPRVRGAEVSEMVLKN